MITSEICIGKYTGDGVATEFAIPFKYRLNNDLTAQIQVMTYDGTDIAYLEQGEDFEVVPYTNEEIEEKDDTGGSGGSLLGKIVFEIAPAVGLKIAILRNIPLVQRTDWVNGENVDMEAIEGEFDQLIMCLQQMQERATRTSTLSVFSDTDPQTIVETIENYATASQVAANQAVEKASEASTSATVAETSAGNAAGSASDALSAANVAESMATSASNSASASANSAGNASDSAVLAKRYAVGLPTEPAEYSAKYWAEKAAETMAEMPTKVSELENDAGYTTNVGTVTSINNVLPDSNGNVSLTVPGATWGNVNGNLSDQPDLQNALNAKQNTLVSGTNIKTINGNSVLGSGDITISGGGIQNTATGTDSLTILGNPASDDFFINIGSGSGINSTAEEEEILCPASIAIGVQDNSLDGAKVGGQHAIAIGTGTNAEESGVAIGYASESGTSGVAVGGGTSANSNGVAVGGGANASGTSAVAIGTSSNALSANSISIGASSLSQVNRYATNGIGINGKVTGTTSARANNSIAIGGNVTNAQNAIQLGSGTNSTANSLQVGSYPLLDTSTGLIPDARISSNIARTADVIPTSDLAPCHVVVETYHSGVNWYRVYSDGWCEQGQMFQTIANNTNITFLKPFASNSYSLSTTNIGTGGSGYGGFVIANITSTGFTVTDANYGKSDKTACWEAKGYIA